MAADGGALKRLFEKPLPENPTLLEALSAWNHTHRKKLVDPASFTEIFGELHFQEKPVDVAAAVRAHAARPSPSPPPPPPPRRTVSWLDVTDAAAADNDKSKDDSSLDALLKPPKPASGATVKRSASFCLKSSTSLLLCTEGLGSESTVDADDMVKDGDNAVADASVDNEMDVDASDGAVADAAFAGGKEKRPPSFPPPIRSIGRGGKPCVCFRSVRAEGRFVLLEVVIPGKDLLRATREGGRLRLQFANAAAAAAAVGIVDEEEMHGEAVEAAACVSGDTFA